MGLFKNEPNVIVRPSSPAQSVAQQKPPSVYDSFSGSAFSIIRPRGRGGMFVGREVKFVNGRVVDIIESDVDMWDVVAGHVERKMHDQMESGAQ